MGRDLFNHWSLLPEEGWPVPLPQYRQEKLQRVPQRRYGQAEEIFLCAAAHPGLQMDSGEADATSMLFSELADACLDEALVPAVTDLLRLKMETPEIGLGPRIDVINDYLDASIEEIDHLIQAIPSDEKVTWDELNRLFLKTVGLVK